MTTSAELVNDWTKLDVSRRRILLKAVNALADGAAADRAGI